MTTTTNDIVLIAGLWLNGPAAWAETAAALQDQGLQVTAVALPGQGDGRTDATLQDQLDAVLAAVDAAENPLVVGHSAACTLAWLAADRRPDSIAGTALIGGFPSTDGSAYADFFEPVDGGMAFPGWGPFEGPDSADISAELNDTMVAESIPVPVGVSRGVVRLTDERRFAVPTTMICPEFTPDQAKEWVAAGDVPEIAAAQQVSYVDIDSGHWPMFTRPVELAAVIAAVARG
ncbi:alpha/beta fold hydrolase [Nakamurella sp. YIM 132087]|uniref:Alpha/beta fold hydrolase n=1 Tax=Nakamurella alba TaxID=2665158 RepID=A0A7K1FNT4_9ACTN|nr:alpha/beta hydrolase [Nakamurella alba]MTD14883.1 alpha/beta fold hydrolase [Nakamurella alba]